MVRRNSVEEILLLRARIEGFDESLVFLETRVDVLETSIKKHIEDVKLLLSDFEHNLLARIQNSTCFAAEARLSSLVNTITHEEVNVPELLKDFKALDDAAVEALLQELGLRPDKKNKREQLRKFLGIPWCQFLMSDGKKDDDKLFFG
ncbi:hypothetical protein F4777DRAFT_521832 [Nemania sp. FL0916]|nr:hypothetical protein F4777DRAFT_521832 [Nemania sp. FL0916]